MGEEVNRAQHAALTRASPDYSCLVAFCLASKFAKAIESNRSNYRLTLGCALRILPPRMLFIVAAAVVAFVDVAVIPMDRERVELHQTVLVRDDRIVAVGPATTIAAPADANVIDGRGR